MEISIRTHVVGVFQSTTENIEVGCARVRDVSFFFLVSPGSCLLTFFISLILALRPRSVTATAFDQIYCMQLAQNAVHGAMAGYTAFSAGVVNNRTV